MKRVPLVGCFLFIVLYIIATIYYPGGSPINTSTIGFSWSQNYWCNLLSERSINGLPNSSRHIAFAAMVILCLTLITFWYFFTKQIVFKRNERFIILFSVIASMVLALFIYTSFHDMIINISATFGLIAIVGTLIGLNRMRWAVLFCMGINMLALIAINNILYYNKDLILYLPIIQKITFLYFLIWISLMNIRMLKKVSITSSAVGKLPIF
jgi:hypothetical protein